MMALERRDGLFFVVIFFGLLVRLALAPPIWHHGEAREALVVQGIVDNHEWILPLRNGEMPSKPPFFHWLAALPAFVFGPSDWIVRLPSAIGAATMAGVTFFMGNQMGGRKTGWLAAGALLGMHEFWISGSQARVDMVFAACIALALAGFFFWYRDGRRGTRATCYVASACAVLAKGPVGLILPGLTIISFLIFEGRLRDLWAFWSWPLAALLLLVDLGWYAFAYNMGGNEFLGLQIATENVDRFFGRGSFSTENTSFDTLVWLARQTLPWNLVLVWSLIRRIKGAREDWAGRFLHTWWISIFVCFVLAARSRPVYLLPMYPAIALLAARAIGDRIRSFTEPSDIESIEKARRPWWRPKPIVKRVGVGVAIFDLTLMLLVKPTYWTDRHARNARLAFIEDIRAIVSPPKQLFSAPEVDPTDAMVIAYRLEREIARKPLICASPNDYFLLRSDSTNVPGVETQVLASSTSDEVSLVAVIRKTASAELVCIR
jgi:4-amino-4-deoxy-L-arabinose transferase-like glycosyltransferase